MRSDFGNEIVKIPILDYAQRIGLHPYRVGRNYFTLKEHDSVRINIEKNCFWWNSANLSGTIVDFSMAFTSARTAKEAMKQLANMYGVVVGKRVDLQFHFPKSETRDKEGKKEKDNELNIPKKSNKIKAVFDYLYHERKINREVIRYFLAKKLLYQDEHNNCVFITKDFCCIRSTGESRFVQDREGSNYNECFYIEGRKENNSLIVAESVIDIMSIMSKFCDEGKPFVAFNYLALSGTTKYMSIKYHLKKNSKLKNVVLCFDNDHAGQIAFENTIESLKEIKSVKIYKEITPIGKDWNDYIRATGQV